MSDLIRCSACRGAKKVPKLGGMIGDCNTCKGLGQIKASDAHVMVKPQPVPVVTEIIKAVSDCVPASDALSVEPEIKIDPQKAIYKRKTTGSK